MYKLYWDVCSSAWYTEYLLTMCKALGLIFLNMSKKRLKVEQSTLYNL